MKDTRFPANSQDKYRFCRKDGPQKWERSADNGSRVLDERPEEDIRKVIGRVNLSVPANSEFEADHASDAGTIKKKQC